MSSRKLYLNDLDSAHAPDSRNPSRQFDNYFKDRIVFMARYESLSPQHANAHANANLRLRAAVSGEANDLLSHL
jgi:hypothetical protein